MVLARTKLRSRAWAWNLHLKTKGAPNRSRIGCADAHAEQEEVADEAGTSPFLFYRCFFSASRQGSVGARRKVRSLDRLPGPSNRLGAAGDQRHRPAGSLDRDRRCPGFSSGVAGGGHLGANRSGPPRLASPTFFPRAGRSV